MKYIEQYDCYVDSDGVIYVYGEGKKHKAGKLYQPKRAVNAHGYEYVPIHKKMVAVHRLIGLAFISNDDPDNKVFIDHIDRDRTNNSFSNLRWVTPRQNSLNSKRSDDCLIKYGMDSISNSKAYCHARYEHNREHYIQYARDRRKGGV